MAYDSKFSFIEELRKGLENDFTAAQLRRIGEVARDVLTDFDIVEVPKGAMKDDLIDVYLDALNVECRSQKTIDRYRYVIGRLMDFVKVPTCRVTVYHIRAFLAAEKERGVSDSSLESYREVYTAYFNWLQRESLIEKNPTSNLGAIKCAKKEKKTYSEIDLEKLNQKCKTIRDRAIINFLASTGCRISEMTGLNRNSVNLDALECVVRGKGNKERVVYLSEVAGMFLREYLESRKDNCEALFANRRGGRFLPGGVRAMLNEIAKASGVDHVHPHKFRRTLATELCRHGMPIQEVANILGHDKIDTTMQYVVLSKDGIKSSYRRFA